MNSHLNVFNTYSKENRVYQLENDLTRAFAICMQEDALFFYEVLRVILNDDEQLDLMFCNTDVENKLSINIQVNTKSVSSYSKIIAVSLSEVEMNIESFLNSNNKYQYDPICDIVIEFNEILIIIEAKRDGVDCTSQLYNQAYNILSYTDDIEKFKDIVEPRDLNWRKLMQIASKVYSFQKTIGNVGRLTLDFINLVKGHNPNWFPETPISLLSSSQLPNIRRRIESAINFIDIHSDYKKLTYNDRLGLSFSKPWGQEILFHIFPNGNLGATIYAGNTKAQGWHIFNKRVKISNELHIEGVTYKLHQCNHIKLTSFQKFFTGLWIDDQSFKKEGLYSREHYEKYTGRKFKDKGDWTALENLFDEYIIETFDWRSALKWNEKVINSNKTQFDLSFGYEFYIVVPFEELKKRDMSSTNLDGLVNLIKSTYKAFEENLIK